MDQQRVEWNIRGWFERARVVRAQDVRPAERSLERSGALAARSVRDWFEDDRARPVLLRLYEELARGAAFSGDGLPTGALDRHVIALVERAFHDREIVLLEERQEPLPPLAEHTEVRPSLSADDRATGMEDDWIEVGLFDSAGDPIEGAAFTVMHGTTKVGEGSTGADGVGRISSIPPRGTSVCTVSFETWAKEARALPIDAPPVGPPKLDRARVRGPIDGPHRVLRRELLVPQGARLVGTNVYQLRRRTATVIELEHFTDDGAVFLPGFSPARLRDGAMPVTGIDTLKAVFEHAKNEQHVLVTGHHASVSKERAENIQLLLMGKRNAWASLSARVAKPADKEHIRAWATEPLPDEEWTTETWSKVFDLYIKKLVPQAPPRPKRHKLVVRSTEKENIYPVKMAEITFGWQHAKRAEELEPLNPHLVRGHWNWRDIHPGDEICMPEAWPPEPLLARGFKVVPVDAGDDPPAAEPPHLAHAPRAVGCGNHHLEHPYAKSPERRGEKRHAEVVILPEDALVCSQACDTNECWVYDPMAYELHVAPLPGSLPKLLLSFYLGVEESVALVVHDSNDGTTREIPHEAARVEEKTATFGVDVAALPPLARVSFRTPSEHVAHGTSFAPAALAAALRSGDLALASAVLNGLVADSVGAGPGAAPAVDEAIVEVHYENRENRWLQTMQVGLYSGATQVGTTQKHPRADGTMTLVFRVKSSELKARAHLKVRIPSPLPSKPPILDVDQELMVERAGGSLTLRPVEVLPQGNGGLDRRLTLRGTGTGGQPGKILSVDLDVLFLNVDSYVQDLAHLPDADKRRNRTYHEYLTKPRKCGSIILDYTGSGPPTWALLFPPAVDPDRLKVNLLLFFTNENQTKIDNGGRVNGIYSRCEDADYGRVDAYFSRAPRGTYVVNGVFTDRRSLGWDAELAAAARPVILAFPLPRNTDFGDLNTPGPKTERIVRGLLRCLWSTGHVSNAGGPPQRGRLALSGWSSGTDTLWDWCRVGGGYDYGW